MKIHVHQEAEAFSLCPALRRIKKYFTVLPINTSVCILCLFQIVLSQDPPPDYFHEGCTIGVAAGRATSDGRPLLWKTRDGRTNFNNAAVYYTSQKYRFIAIINAGDPPDVAWMGVNEKGFAIVDSDVYDLPRGSAGHT